MFTFFLKEIRQLRRDPVFWGTLIVQLVLCALIIALCKIFHADGENRFFSHGYDNLGVLAAMIVAIAMSMRWHSEMNDDALNPVVTTPLPPAKIVAGKYLATWIAVLTPLALAQIFIVATVPQGLSDLYLKLRLPMNAAILATASAFLLTVSPARIKSGFVCSVLPGMFLLFILISVWLPQSFLLRMLHSEEGFRYWYIYAIVRMLLPIPLLFVMTVAAVSPAGSDRAIPVRIALLATLAAYMLVYWLEIRNAHPSSQELASHAALLCWTGAFFSAFAAVAERAAQSARVVAAIRRAPVWLRPLRTLCSTGAIPEMIFSLVLAAVAIAFQKNTGKFSAMHPQIAYLHLFFCASFALAFSGVIHMAFRRRVAVWLRYVILYAVNNVLGIILIADIVKNRRPYLLILGALSLLLLIPAGIEFVKSLKQK